MRKSNQEDIGTWSRALRLVAEWKSMHESRYWSVSGCGGRFSFELIEDGTVHFAGSSSSLALLCDELCERLSDFDESGRRG